MESLSSYARQASLPLGTLDARFASTPPASSSPVLHVKQFRSYQLRLPVTGICLLSGLLLALLSPPRILIGSTLNQGLIATGYILLALGVAIRIWSITYIHSRKSVSIVTTGPYSLCRNPLYVGTLLIVIAYLLMVQSATLAVCFIPVMLLYVWGVIPVEETVLRSRHPAAYDAYCAEVPRWLPRLRMSAFARARLVWSRAVRREVECALWWVGIALLVHFVCSFRMAAWWTHPLLWP